MKPFYQYSDLFDVFSDAEKKLAPKQLYHEGNFNFLLKGLKVAVVGSRDVSEAGKQRTQIVCQALVKKDIAVVSGLALGVDTVAHKTALHSGGRTIAVLGSSLDQCSPAENASLLEEIKKNHLAVSQFPSGTPTRPGNFPQRNRTMALLSDATIIIEATEQSGTKHQGWEALRLGRPVFLLSNLVQDGSITWAKEMLEYGAVELVREDLDAVLESLSNLTIFNEPQF